MTQNLCNTTKAWRQLERLAKNAEADLNLLNLFKNNNHRFDELSFSAPNIFADLSKQHINNPIFNELIALARECNLECKRNAMMRGDIVNLSENRPALHCALRSTNKNAPYQKEVRDELAKMHTFAQEIRDDEQITDIVNIGIGGSDLGPRMAVKALRPFTQDNKRYHFISNIDPFEISGILQKLQPKNTLFIIASKSFATQETLANALTAKLWFESNGGINIAHHFTAVTTNLEAARAFGIKRVFSFWDWVGGRYSLWSAVGLSLAIAIGEKHFTEFLRGAEQMDEHFANAPLNKNLPIILSLVDIWNRNFLKRSARNIAPYHQGLARFPAYLQQLEMESNGKSTSIDGSIINYQTSGSVWGEAGSNGQHAFFQMLHQGTEIIPVDFILIKKLIHSNIRNKTEIESRFEDQHTTLFMNGVAQSRALMAGNTQPTLAERRNVTDVGITTTKVDSNPSYKHFEGNRPSTTLLLDELTPQSLGSLIALHEHRTFSSGAIWNINSFDQWGVELGKKIVKQLQENTNLDQLDNSTQQLIACFNKN